MHTMRAFVARLNPAFSPRALLDQEPILQKNVDLLMEKLKERAEQGLSSDLRAWYNNNL